MSGHRLTRRAALLAGAGTAAALLSGCDDEVDPPAETADDESALLGKLLVIEHAQSAAYDAMATVTTDAAQERWAAQAALEREHTGAIGTLLNRLGSPVPQVRTTPVTLPSGEAARLRFLADLEDRSAAAWRHVTPRATQDIVRLGCLSILAVEIRQASWLRLATGRPAPVQAPAPRSIDAVVASVRDIARFA